MQYSDKVMDHFNHPRNVGRMDKNDPNDAIKAAVEDYRSKQAKKEQK